MQHARFSAIASACATFALGLLVVAPAAQADPSLRSELYSVGSNDRFCSRAQQIVSSTGLYSYNILHIDLTTFGNSSPSPYNGANTASYTGTLAWNATGNTMPLHTQQLVSQRVLGNTQWEYPIVNSCKMKSAEGLNAMFGPGTAGAQKTCKEVVQDTVARVYASLTSIEQRTLRWTQDQIIFPNDIVQVSGPTWLYPLPYLPRVAFIGVADGKLRLRGYSLTVAQNDTSGLVGPDKMGTYYCHLPAPEYVRALITGQTDPIMETPPE